VYPSLISNDNVPIWEQDIEKQQELDSLLIALTIEPKFKVEDVRSHKLFLFDPNQIDSLGMLLLGFSPYMAKNLLAYKKSGGNIAYKADLKKIYGMTEDLYHELEPYVQIASKMASDEPKFKTELKSFDLNKVDSIDLSNLGFSRFQANSILRYRKEFGPYRKKEELKKVYGINSSDFKKYEKYILIGLDDFDTKTYLFPFDPNLTSRNAWDSLGVKSSVVNRINNFLSKGGQFYKARDLMRIYGLDSSKYIELEPYINIPKDPIVEKIQVDLNNADSAQLISLPGIGPYFTTRILNYREKLGGFYSLYQMSDIKGIRKTRLDSLKSYLFVDVNSLRFININKSNVDELSRHPYISYKEASDIVRLRKRKGPIVDLEILNKRRVFSKSTFKRVKPYLILE
jgi:DNA uptake protein ComE-like DNA-binding protein